MAESVFKIIEVSGTSKTDIEGAIQNAISKTAETIRNLRWLEVIETRGAIEKDRVAYWQVTVKIGFNVGKEIPAGGSAKTAGGKTGASKYRCKVCGYLYDPEKGDPSQEVKPGTPFEELPDSWRCPECGVGKDQFEKI